VVALEVQDVVEGRVGVLCFVEQDVVGSDVRVGQLPYLQVVVVFHLEFAASGIPDIVPGAVGIGQHRGGQHAVDGGVFGAALQGDVFGVDVLVCGLAEAKNSLLGDVCQAGALEYAFVDREFLAETKEVGCLPRGDSGGAESVRGTGDGRIALGGLAEDVGPGSAMPTA
jgi:hypothetical protein